MVEVADAVVAEEVGVGEHGDAAGAVLGDGGERGAGRVGGGGGAGEDAGAVGGGEGAGAVEAGGVDAGEEVGGRGRRGAARSARTQEGASRWCS